MSKRLSQIAALIKELTYEEMIEFGNDFLRDSVCPMLSDMHQETAPYTETIDEAYFPSIISDWADENLMEND